MASFCRETREEDFWNACLEEVHTGDFDKIHARIRKIRELKMETFSGRRRPDWQRKPGSKAAVASRQK